MKIKFFMGSIAVCLFATCIYSLESNPFFSTEYELFKLLNDSSGLNGEFGEQLYDYVENPSTEKLEMLIGNLPVIFSDSGDIRYVHSTRGIQQSKKHDSN